MGARPHGSHSACLAGLLALLAGSSGAACSTSQLDFRHLPSPEALASIQPGVTTRSEVLRRLGPPEELRRPANFDRARATTPQHRRILEEGRVFEIEAFTYASAQRRTTSVALLPVGPALFRVSSTRSLESRWRIEFDASGVVTSLSRRNELEETE